MNGFLQKNDDMPIDVENERHKTYYIRTYGCQMNEHDTEVMSGILEQMGYVPADDIENADIILFNTCCVRENAENKVYGRLGQMKTLKEQRPDVIIGVCGCMVQQESERLKIEQSLPHVDLVFGTHNIHELPMLIEEVKEKRGRVIRVWDEDGDIREGLPVKRESGLKAWVTIMYGCNNFCTYCIVPYVRGRERSREFEKIIEEVRELGKAGYKEVTLLGQNVNSYGKDLGENRDFADLLMAVNKIDGIERIRFTTSHPKDITDKLIMAIAEGEKICEHIHFPLQAGSNRILKKMNRRYTLEYYLGLVEKIRESIPEVAITTDLIVGFPGETEEDFRETLRAVELIRYDSAFTFIYSPRKGTPACRLEDNVPIEEKRERLYRLIELQNRISYEKNREMVGKVIEIMVDGPSEKDSKIFTGRSRGNKLILFDPPEGIKPGNIADVLIEKAGTWTLEGSVQKIKR